VVVLKAPLSHLARGLPSEKANELDQSDVNNRLARLLFVSLREN
jgi:hypothetical protein